MKDLRKRGRGGRFVRSNFFYITSINNKISSLNSLDGFSFLNLGFFILDYSIMARNTKMLFSPRMVAKPVGPILYVVGYGNQLRFSSH